MELLFVFIAYAALNIHVSKRIRQANYKSESKRQNHELLVWFVPFLGAFITRKFWAKRKKEKLEVMTKANRKFDNSHFYESGKGIY